MLNGQAFCRAQRKSSIDDNCHHRHPSCLYCKLFIQVPNHTPPSAEFFYLPPLFSHLIFNIRCLACFWNAFFMLSRWMSDQTISIESLLYARHNAGCWGYNIKTRHNVVPRAYIIQYIIIVVMAGQSPVRVYTHGRSLFHMLRESLLSDFKMRPKEGGSWRPCSGMRDKTMYRKGLRWKGAWIQRQGQYCCNVRLVEIGQQMIETFTLCRPWWELWCKPNISIVSYGGNLSFTCVWNSGYFLLDQFLSPNVGLFTSCCLLY